MSIARAAVILAAGQGTRMKSKTPKVLHPVGGRPMIDSAIAVAEELGCDRIVVVVGAHSPEVGEHIRKRHGDAAVAVQDPPLGTAHAVRAAEARLDGFEGDVAILYGDSPLIQADTVRRMFDRRRETGAGMVILGFEAKEPTGYGRLIRDDAGRLARIVEEKEADDAERAIRLCNSGVLIAEKATLFSLLSLVRNDNSKGEFYLTDVVGLGRSAGLFAEIEVVDEQEVLGVNSRVELALAERAFQDRRRRDAMLAGVTLLDPSTVYFSYDTVLESDVVVEPGVFFGPGVHAASGARIKAWSHVEGARIGPGAQVGPFVRLRPGAVLEAQVKLGNFVEVKNAVFGEKSQASHLTYVGDAEIGARANLGCGTITCNYDGFDKHLTRIGADAFIGSDTALVAPVTVGARAMTGSGSVITSDVPDGALSIGRGRQRNIEGWADRFRDAKAAAKAARADKRKSEA